jgi:hypothetical protein
MGHTAAHFERLVKDIFEQLPGTMRVGVGQGGTARDFRQAQMPQLALAGLQAVGDVAQAVDRAQLAEQHGHQLAPAGETLGVALGLMLPDRGIETGTWNQFQNLGENARYCGQGCVLL